MSRYEEFNLRPSLLWKESPNIIIRALEYISGIKGNMFIVPLGSLLQIVREYYFLKDFKECSLGDSLRKLYRNYQLDLKLFFKKGRVRNPDYAIICSESAIRFFVRYLKLKKKWRLQDY